jgi:HEAT repeat protein
VWRLEAFIAKADQWRPRKSHEELAQAAVLGLGQLRHQAAVDALKNASLSRSRAVRNAAKAELERIKKGQ